MLDIILIDAVGELDYEETAEAARSVFSERATHDFPPEAQFPAEWSLELEASAKDLGFPIRTASQIQDRFREIVAALSGAANYDK
ncbi:MAG: hypothetical protein WA324_24920 [Bryobacteraceae bacterium]